MLRVSVSQGEYADNIQIVDETAIDTKSRIASKAFPNTRLRLNLETVLVAKIDDIAVGVLCTRNPDKHFQESEAHGYLDCIYVKNEYKNLGVERALLSELLRKEKEKGRAILNIETLAPKTITFEELQELGGDVEEFLEEDEEIDFSFFFEYFQTAQIALKLLSHKNVSRRTYNQFQIEQSLQS